MLHHRSLPTIREARAGDAETVPHWLLNMQYRPT